MNVRVTPQVSFQRSNFDLARTFSRLVTVQGQLSSGRRIHNVSDDPASATRALDTRLSQIRTARVRENLDIATFASDFQAATLEQISTLIASAREKAQQAASGINGDEELDILATEIDSILNEALSLANQSSEGRFLFAGSQVNTKPFQSTKSDGKVTSVSYAGDDIVRKLRLGPGELLDMELSGHDIFLGLKRGPTLLSGNTGLAGAAGKSDTILGSVNISLSHTATQFGDGLAVGGGDSASGLAAGTSTADDTILGDHTLLVGVNASGDTTLTLDDGIPIAFDATSSDVLLKNASGDTVHVDVTSLAAGFTGSVTLHGDGNIKVGDAAATPLTFSSEVAFTDAEGRVLYLDTTSIERVGQSTAVAPGTETVFDVLIALRDDLRGESGFDPSSLVERTTARIASLDKAHDGVLIGLSRLGAMSGTFERINGSLALFEIGLEEKRSQLEDTDVFEASLELAQAETAHQAALQVAARIATLPNLGDFI